MRASVGRGADGHERSLRAPAAPAGSPCTATGAGPVVAGRCRCHAPGVAARVLIVDDHAPFRSLARRLLVAGGVRAGGGAAGGGCTPPASRAPRPGPGPLVPPRPPLPGATVAAERTPPQAAP